VIGIAFGLNRGAVVVRVAGSIQIVSRLIDVWMAFPPVLACRSWAGAVIGRRPHLR